MLKFSEYVHQRNQQIEEGWGDAFRNFGRFSNGVVSGVGRTPIQAVRGAGNMIGGAAQGGWGAAQTAAGLGKGMFGGGWDTAGNGLQNMGRGAGRFASGVGQGLGAASGLTGVGRAVAAAKYPDNDQIRQAPNYDDPNAWGSFKHWMGWQGKPTKPEPAEIPHDAWVPDRPQQTQPNPSPAEIPHDAWVPDRTQQTQPNPSAQARRARPSRSQVGIPRPQQPPDQWIRKDKPQPVLSPEQQALFQKQQAFFQKYPGFNQQGLSSTPLDQPVSSNIGFGNQQTASFTTTPNFLDDYERPQNWNARTGNKRGKTPPFPVTNQETPISSNQRTDVPASVTASWNQGSNAASRMGVPESPQVSNQGRSSGATPAQNNPQMPDSAINSPLAPFSSGSIPARPNSAGSQEASQVVQTRRPPDKIPPQVLDHAASTRFMFDEKKGGRWDGKSDLQPYQIQGAVKDLNTYIRELGGNPKYADHVSKLKDTVKYLDKLLNRKT